MVSPIHDDGKGSSRGLGLVGDVPAAVGLGESYENPAPISRWRTVWNHGDPHKEATVSVFEVTVAPQHLSTEFDWLEPFEEQVLILVTWDVDYTANVVDEPVDVIPTLVAASGVEAPAAEITHPDQHLDHRRQCVFIVFPDEVRSPFVLKFTPSIDTGDKDATVYLSPR